MEPYILIPWVVLHELEHIKNSNTGKVQFTAQLSGQALAAMEFIEQHVSEQNSKIIGKIKIYIFC